MGKIMEINLEINHNGNFNMTDYRFYKNNGKTINVYGDVNLASCGLDKLEVKFGKIYGSFNLFSNNITSLENLPYECERFFDIDQNSKMFNKDVIKKVCKVTNENSFQKLMDMNYYTSLLKKLNIFDYKKHHKKFIIIILMMTFISVISSLFIKRENSVELTYLSIEMMIFNIGLLFFLAIVSMYGYGKLAYQLSIPVAFFSILYSINLYLQIIPIN